MRRGDTLGKIAKRHRTTVKALMRLNRDRIEHPSLLEVGDYIRLPKARKRKGRRGDGPRRSARLHRVRRGETLKEIAKRYGTSIKTLMRLNRDRIEHPLILEAGVRIRLPKRARARR